MTTVTSYGYSRSSNVDSPDDYDFYNKNRPASEEENNASVIYMKSTNLPPGKLYGSMLSHDYEENQNLSNEQVRTDFILFKIGFVDCS